MILEATDDFLPRVTVTEIVVVLVLNEPSCCQTKMILHMKQVKYQEEFLAKKAD